MSDTRALHAAVARAIYEAAPVTPGMQRASWEAACHPQVHVDRDLAPAAAAVICVVLAEAQQSILSAIDASDDYYIGGYVNDELHRLVEAALAALAGDAA